MARSGSKNDESVRSASTAVGPVAAHAARSQIPFPEWSDQDVNAEKWEMPKVLLLHFQVLVLNHLHRFTFLNLNLGVVTPESNNNINNEYVFIPPFIYL